MTDQSLLAAWGVTTTAGYLATHAMGVAGTEVFGMSVFGSIVAVWALLMIPPVGMTVALKARGGTDAHPWIWVGLVAAALAVNAGVVAGGGGHTHDGSGHGGAAEDASGHGEAGHHAESSGTGGAGGPSTAETARGEGSGGDGHTHPDGGHEGEPTRSPDAGEDDPGGHAHPDGGHGNSAGADARESGGPAPADDAASTPPGGSDAGGHGGETGDRLVDAAELQHAAYFHLWFLVGALGFAYSAAVAHGGARKALYGTAALLNAMMVLALVAVPDARGIAFLVAAAVQGLPMLVDLPLRARADRTVA